MRGEVNYIIYTLINNTSIHINERCRRKEERSTLGHTNKQGKATQYTQEAVTFPKKNELPWVGFAGQTLSGGAYEYHQTLSFS